MSRTRKFKKFLKTNARPILFVVGFALVGGITLYLVKAASPSVAFEAENGTLAGVTQVSDATASANSAVMFGNTSGLQGIAACDPSKGMADEACWAANTGVMNTTTSNQYDRWTEAQIRAGQASAQLTHIDGATSGNGTGYTVDNAHGIIHITQSGTAGNPFVFCKQMGHGLYCR